MEKASEIYKIISLGLVASWFSILLYFRFVTGSQIKSMITAYYDKQDFSITYISKLTYAERIQYGVPINVIMWMYGFFFTIHKLGDHHFRGIEIIDKKDQKEYIKYVDLYIRKRKLIFCDEFKSVDFS